MFFYFYFHYYHLIKNVSGARDFHSIQKMVWREKKKKNVATICV